MLAEAGSGLTPKCGRGQVWRVALEIGPVGLVDGVRPILENSTACQKSMPIPRRRGMVLVPVWGLVLVCPVRIDFLWLTMIIQQ